MRFAHTLFVISLLAPLPAAWAQSAPHAVLTEADAVRSGLARNDLADLEQGSTKAAEADALAAGQRPNPVLSYGYDRVGGTPDTVEHSLMLSQTFDPAHRRDLRRQAADRRADAVGADHLGRRVGIAAEIRREFHAALYRQAVVQAADTWVQRFARIEALVAKLARAGEASGYDQRRLTRERVASEVRLVSERAELERALTRLGVLAGRSDRLAVAGELSPPPLPALDAALGRLDQRPDLLALARRAEAADLEGRAAGKGGIPEITVGIGPKWVDNGFRKDNGVVVALSMPLPVFDRQQAGRQRAAGEAMQHRAEYRLAHTRAEGDLRGLHRQAAQLRTAAADYRRRAVAPLPDLLRIAELAYQGGESSLLELLDAYRGALETEIAALDLEHRARAARIEYDLITGSVE
ncbi:MAG: TolC family protein [Betaproteobacteria bacterium]|nr:TolC family protein [Betaproteobacteria bacterium]